MAHANLLAGWIGILAGVVSGALIGLFFHREGWLGGYDSFRRRMVRLGHISFFGIAFLNMFFGLTIQALAMDPAWTRIASSGFIAGAVTMPLCCFLTAWRKPMRHFFPIPVISLLTGILCILKAWPPR